MAPGSLYPKILESAVINQHNKPLKQNNLIYRRLIFPSARANAVRSHTYTPNLDIRVSVMPTDTAYGLREAF